VKNVRSSAAIALASFLALGLTVFAQDDENDSLNRDYEKDLPRIAPTEAADVQKTFEIDSDYRIDLVAAEPLVHDPIAMAFDEQSRLFVVEMRGYSERRDMDIGAVRMLTDNDGDGVYDTSDVYIDGLKWPTAVACYDDGIFVAAPPNIHYFKDTDGDGKADIKEEVFTGFGLGNVQGLLNSFHWTLENRITGATSSSGGNITTPTNPDAKPVAVRGRDFAFNPKTRKFEAVSGGAQHGLTFDLDGNKFICHNSNQMIQVMYDDHYMARNPYIAAPSPKFSAAKEGAQADVFRISDIEPWRVIRTRLRVKGLVPGPTEGGKPSGFFTSATGITVYKGDAWPEEARGQIIVADVGSNLVHRKKVTSDGLTIMGERIDENKEFLASTDNWFRPVQFENGPDGALYVADMYREVIEHPASLPPLIKKFLDLNSGYDRGRIYRIVPKDYQQPKLPNLGEADNATLVTLLEHKNAWHVETASRLLYERQAKDVTVPLQAMARLSESEHGRMRALYVLASIDSLRLSDVGHALNDVSPVVRTHALKLSEPFLADSAKVGRKIATLINDPSLKVRYQLAFTLGELPNPSIHLNAFVALALKDGSDAWMRNALLSSLTQGSSGVLVALLNNESFGGNGDQRKFLEQLSMLAGTTGQGDAVKQVLDSAEKLVTTNRDIAQSLVRGLIDGLQKAPNSSAAQEVLAQSDMAKSIIDTMKVNALKTVSDTKQKEAARIAEVKALSLAPYSEVKEAILPLLNGSPGMRLAALRALRSYDDPEIAPAVLQAWSGYTPTAREAALELLLSKTASLNLLLDAIEAGHFTKTNITSNRVAYLQAHSDKTIAERAKKLFVVQTSAELEAKLERYQAALKLKGDVKAGRIIFEQRCAQCHKVYDLGYGLGPDLATMANRGEESILVNVIDPNREINPQYVNFNIETKNGDLLTGVVDSETSTSVTLVRAGGLKDTILRSNIVDIYSSDLSIMPVGLDDGLSEQDMADLIAFLMESNKKEN
jgi:putative membrane-bound dehydrogenase-like protein